ncbi:hypothetical protein [Pseudarthrobacter oxydans]|uniref:hypothetical protein n=1 Tax=Pseudarthrobacter oxydans TaxID=1671 RepID=UPI00343B8E13
MERGESVRGWATSRHTSGSAEAGSNPETKASHGWRNNRGGAAGKGAGRRAVVLFGQGAKVPA